ncbi:MAG: ParB/RepB/Spo0J family partition protein [Candidatus Pelagibacter sp. TMED118]|nr:MAG: ParB/RepB/Spo0J family partition protein [Candidatus Pelagibacter sp. TMED118]
MNPFKNKKGLGRGLSSLIGDNNLKVTNNTISISAIVANKFQPRKKFDKESLEELTNSIKEKGVIQPLIVRLSEDHNNKYELIAGERRLQASQSAGLHEVPAVIVDADNLKSLEFAIIENVQRKDLNPIEEAKGYKKLIDEFGYDQEKVSKFIGKSRTHVTNTLRLLSLPDDVINFIDNEKLSQGHAKVIVGLSNASMIAKRIINKKLSVRQTENFIRSLKSKKDGKSLPKDANILILEDSLKSKTGINVSIKNKRNNTGLVSFEYKDLDQLNRLIMVLKANY